MSIDLSLPKYLRRGGMPGCAMRAEASRNAVQGCEPSRATTLILSTAVHVTVLWLGWVAASTPPLPSQLPPHQFWVMFSVETTRQVELGNTCRHGKEALTQPVNVPV